MPAAFSIPSRFYVKKCPFGCGQPIEKGEPITKRGPKTAAAWGHADCAESIGAMSQKKFDDPHGVMGDEDHKLESEGGRPLEEDEIEELPF